MRPIIAAYHFPQWHRDPRNDRWHGEGWTEWDLVRANPTRFPGHRPLLPAWGCHDESDPAQMAREIDLAADNGLDAFIFDTYWYEDGGFLDRAITEGFLRAPNRHRLQFCCMWANHHWHNWHPCNATQKPWDDLRLVDGVVSREAWRKFAERIANWMNEPNYLRLAGRPYFSIYQSHRFIATCGSPVACADEIGRFRDLVRSRCGADPHLAAIGGVLNFNQISPAQLRELGFDSLTPYNQLDQHPIWLAGFPRADWAAFDAANRSAWAQPFDPAGLPTIPNLTTGWDSSARCCPTDRWARRDYPWFSILDHDPQRFHGELLAARAHLTANPHAIQMLTINAWNEWTEGAVLLPTTDHGNAMLEALRNVFPPRYG